MTVEAGLCALDRTDGAHADEASLSVIRPQIRERKGR
jgi:hypothetical protein